MTRQEILQKVRPFLAAGNGQNTYLGVYLLVHQLGWTPAQALEQVVPVEVPDPEGGAFNFTCHYQIAYLHIEYTVMEGYVPYMGAGVTATRLVGVDERFLPYLDTSGWAGYLSIEDGQEPEHIRQLIREDYKTLIPQVVDWLNARPETAFISQ